jgi:hypothetical protein
VQQNLRGAHHLGILRATCRCSWPGEGDEVVACQPAPDHTGLEVHPIQDASSSIPDGNGRLARWLADIMAAQAGYPVPDYGLSGRGSVAQRHRYIAAVSQGYARNYEPLAVFFVEAVERRGR